MRITEILSELTGVKKHPAFQAVKDLEYGEPDEGNTEYDPKKMGMVIQQLGKLGWLPIGSGYWSKVFSHPSKPYVLKIFMDDTNYLEYLQIVKANQSNPHVPKIIGRPAKISSTVNAVRLEKLTPVTGEDDPIFEKYVDPSLSPDMYNAFDIDGDNKEFAEKNHPEWVKLLNAIQPIIDIGGDMDLHHGNIMKRGNTLVLIDP